MDSWPAAARARQLLRSLGLLDALDERGFAMGSPTTIDDDWADSGLVELCGRADGPALRPSGSPATLARGAELALFAITGQKIETVSRLGQRAALLGLQRHGSTSAGAAARLLPTADGWFALNLPRASDRDLVPALTELAGPDPWASVSHWASQRTTAQVVERGVLLGLAIANVPRVQHAPNEQQPFIAPWTLQPTTFGRVNQSHLRVVNLGALWAAPLCAHLLHECGFEIIDVESAERPDVTVPAFYERLHAGHERRTIAFTTLAGQAELRQTLTDADVVIEASRPRALRNLRADAATIMADGRPRIWLRITGHGPRHERIAFGDDAAAAGGLLAWDSAGPVFAGDAIADPLTGILGALAVVASVRTGSSVIDLPMVRVAQAAAHDGRAPSV